MQQLRRHARRDRHRGHRQVSSKTRDARTIPQRLAVRLTKPRQTVNGFTGSSGGVTVTSVPPTIRHCVLVTDLSGAPVVGATLGTELIYDDGANHAASEVVTVAAVGSGEYRLTYTPTLVGVLYRLRVAVTLPAMAFVTPSEFQDIPCNVVTVS